MAIKRYEPPTIVLDIEAVKELLRVACTLAGSQAEWARLNGISAGYVSDILQGRREPGPDALKALKLRRVVRYVDDKSAGRLVDEDVDASMREGPVPVKDKGPVGSVTKPVGATAEPEMSWKKGPRWTMPGRGPHFGNRKS